MCRPEATHAVSAARQIRAFPENTGRLKNVGHKCPTYSKGRLKIP
ncbi:hypothetical protein HMPREF9123_2655 [Neisseria bacilliformis ATCC BAA-1200]|uniref:Uncharacterized protein n=1 Tax=Neisseria bacilliformis ATCC BAA-1200 TaxID=888742 RepID=F2BFZ8_9NEIS|nr:hypothetical protein HMPREF9123_2655 [Neisseria bacilliformis ATCC BAA-1200]